MRRTRADAKLFALSDAQQAQVVTWLVDDRLPYHKVKELIAMPHPDGFGVSVGLTAFTGFWEKVCVPEVLRRSGRAMTMADSFASKMVEQSSGAIDSALMAGLKQKAFELMIERNPSADALSFLMGQVLKIRDLDLKAEDLKLKRDRFEFKAAEECLKKLPELKAVASDNSLDQDQKLKAIRETLFGTLPPS